jgi:transcriptional regulator with XRE-family HTH domain
MFVVAQDLGNSDATMPRRTEPTPYATKVGARIRELRVERGMTLALLADITSLSKGHLSSVERGLVAITIETINRVAQGFGVAPMLVLAFPAEDESSLIAELVRRLPPEDLPKLRRELQVRLGLRKR